jgi:hypothetical protein
MGLRPIWIKVADAVGFDAFLTMWRTMSENEDLLDERNRVTIASFATYLRFQRNQVIRSLASEHPDARTLREELKRTHKIDLSLSAVMRVLGKMGR